MQALHLLRLVHKLSTYKGYYRLVHKLSTPKGYLTFCTDVEPKALKYRKIKYISSKGMYLNSVQDLAIIFF